MIKIKNINYILIAVLLIFVIYKIILSCPSNNEKLIPVSQKEEIQEKEIISVLPPIEEKWKIYTNSKLGFSIKYPEMVYGVNRCSSEKPFYVPLKIFEDEENGIVYITQEYYYSDWNSEMQNNIGQCRKIINSLEYLKGQREVIVPINGEVGLNQNPFLTKVFIIKDVKNDIELGRFIKDNYGPSCFEKEREQKKQNSVYDITIEGTDWNKDEDGNSERVMTCAWNYIYKILYAPGKNKAMSVKLGQECGFTTDYSLGNYKCYDDIMIDSFRFE